MLDDLITIQEASERYKLSISYIRRLIGQGRLRGRKMGRTWILDPASIDDFLAIPRPKTGRPVDKGNK
ncbi:helix-turn-helix domain-containing protein [Chloroflexota bacterium]